MGGIKKVNTNVFNVKYKSVPKKSLTGSELIQASIEDPSIINNVTKNDETEMFDVNNDNSIIAKATKELESIKQYYKSQGIDDATITKIITKSLTEEETIKVQKILLHNTGLTNSDIGRLISGKITYEQLIKEIKNDKDTTRLERLVQANMLSSTGYYTIEDIDKATSKLDSELINNINKCPNEEQRYYLKQIEIMIKNGTSLYDALNTMAVPYDVNSSYNNLNYGSLLTADNKNMIMEIYSKKEELITNKEYVKLESHNYVQNVLKYQLNSDFEANNKQNPRTNKILESITSSATPDANSPGNYLDYYVTSTEQKVAIISALINGNDMTNGSYVNGVPISSNADENFNHYVEWYKVMTDEEKQTFNFIYNTKGAEAAYTYLQDESLQTALDQRYYYEKQKSDSKWAKENAVAASALSVVMTPVEGLGSMLSTNGTLLHNMITGDNKGIYRTDNISIGTNYRGAVSKDIGEKHGALAQFAYDAGMSMADFAVVAVPTMATGGALMAGAAGTTMLLSNMGTRVYVSAFNDAKDRGLSDADAVKEAWVYAGVETAIERIPLKNLSVLSKAGAGEAANTLTYRATKNVTDRLLKNVSNPNTARRLTKAINMTGAIVSQSVTEGNEELATDIIDAIADDYIAGDKSTFNLKVDEYMAKGYSEDDAIAKTMQDTAKDWARDWALGFVSGAGFGGIAGTVNNYQASGNNIGDITKAIAGNFKNSMFDQNLYLMPPFMSRFSNLFGKNNDSIENENTMSTPETIDEKIRRYEHLLSNYEYVQTYKTILSGGAIYFKGNVTDYNNWVREYNSLSKELGRNDIAEALEAEKKQAEEENKIMEAQARKRQEEEERLRKIEEEKNAKRKEEKRQRVEKYVKEALAKVTKPGELKTLDEKIERIIELEKDKTFIFSYYYRTPSGKMAGTKAFYTQSEEYERLKKEVLEETGLQYAFDYMMDRYKEDGKRQIETALVRLNHLGVYDAFSRINGDSTRSFWKQFTYEQLQQLYDIYSSKATEQIKDEWWLEFMTMGVIGHYDSQEEINQIQSNDSQVDELNANSNGAESSQFDIITLSNMEINHDNLISSGLYEVFEILEISNGYNYLRHVIDDIIKYGDRWHMRHIENDYCATIMSLYTPKQLIEFYTIYQDSSISELGLKNEEYLRSIIDNPLDDDENIKMIAQACANSFTHFTDLYSELVSMQGKSKQIPSQIIIDDFIEKYSSKQYWHYFQSIYFFHVRSADWGQSEDGNYSSKVAKRLYLNLLDFRDTYLFADLFAQKCEAKKLPFYFKVGIVDHDPYQMDERTLKRDESIVIYSSHEQILDYIEICQEIIREHPELTYEKPPALTGVIDDYIGFGAEPLEQANYEMGRQQSFNSLREELIEKSFFDTIDIYTKERGMDPEKIDYFEVIEDPAFLAIFSEKIKENSENYYVDSDNFSFNYIKYDAHQKGENVDYNLIDADVLRRRLETAKKQLDEYATAHNTTLDKLGEPVEKEEISEAREIANELADNLLSAAAQHEKEITRDMESLQDGTSRLINLDSRFKSKERVSDKILDTSKSTNEQSLSRVANNIYDCLRYTLVIEDSNYNQKVNDALKQLKALGYKIVEVKNSWGKPYYQGINVKLEYLDTRLELQFHTEQSFNAKEGDTHIYYEIARNKHNPLVTKEVARKANEIQKIYQGFVTRPKDVTKLKFEEDN